MTDAVLFCSELCKDEAKFVRYYRACAADGRLRRPDVQDALNTRLAMILGGGYRERERRVSGSRRQAVVARDGGRCQVCGAPGDQIDHIDGDSDDPENLQVVCSPCHRNKTREGFKLLSPDEHPEKWEKRRNLLARAKADAPVRLCDVAEWKTTWRLDKRRRREIAKLQSQ